jgi:hypothetical protein
MVRRHGAKSSVRFGRTVTRQNSVGRRLFPLPGGEGRGLSGRSSPAEADEGDFISAFPISALFLMRDRRVFINAKLCFNRLHD